MNTNENKSLKEACLEIIMLHFMLEMKGESHQFNVLTNGYQIILEDEKGEIVITQRDNYNSMEANNGYKSVPITLNDALYAVLG